MEASPAASIPIPNPEPEPQPEQLPPPFITNVQGLVNFRSIGSIAIPADPSTSSTRKLTASPHIYRAGDPAKLADSSISTFRDELGIHTIFDLRSRGELERSLLRPIPGITNLHIPVYVDRDMNPAELAKIVAKYGDDEGVDGFVASYVNILTEGKGAYRVFFRHLLEKPGQGVLVHCSAGKDRTGVAVALVLGLAGVEDGVIADEYALTDVGLRDWKEGVVQMMLKSPGLEGEEVRIRRTLGSRREVMVAFLQRLRTDYGGARGYLVDGLGFTDDEVDRIRENVVVEA